jgi:hypothetical protein
MDRNDVIRRVAEIQAGRLKRPFGRCLEASERLVDALHRRGIHGRILRCSDGVLDAPGADPRWLAIRRAPVSWVHYVVQVDDMIIDLTRRQFFPDAANPHYADPRSLAGEWHTIATIGQQERLAS